MNTRNEPDPSRQFSWQKPNHPPARLPAVWEEHDSCAIVASIRKKGTATHGNLKRVLDALSKMGHRSGEVNGEGDGCGVLTDIPRRLWAEALEKEGKPGWLAEDKRFFVGHLMIPNWEENPENVQRCVTEIIRSCGADLLMDRPAQVRPLSLGRLGRLQAPTLWQIGGIMRNCPLDQVEDCLFDLTLRIERETNVHVASLSSYSVIYKVRGTIETLYHYYPELRSPDYLSAITLGHARYSTNTATAFERVQPFSLLGHNGEINTIARLREQAAMLGIQFVDKGSDSQDLDRTLAAFIHQHGLSLLESMEVLFPPILSEIEKLPPNQAQVYHYYRRAFGPFAQGPASLISRYQDDCVFSVDALGLRPLWFGETEKEFFFSSEKGVYHLDTMRSDPRPLSPGEKMGVRVRRNESVEILEYPAIQQVILEQARAKNLSFHELTEGMDNRLLQALVERGQEPPAPKLHLERCLAAFGWSREGREWIIELSMAGKDPIGSLGYDGPLAALSTERQNLADYFKETVAVVTNPSIDQEREVEHFSTQAVLGKRPSLKGNSEPRGLSISLDCPILISGFQNEALLPEDSENEIARSMGTLRLAELPGIFGEVNTVQLAAVTQPGESLVAGLQRLGDAAIAAVQAGAALIILDDHKAFQEDPSTGQRQGWIDPLLVVSSVDSALRAVMHEHGNLRRSTGLVLRSGAVRNLHDLILMLGAGADAVAPSLLLEAALDDPHQETPPSERAKRLENTLRALKAGLEKIASTMGIHELRGYGRLFSSIGLSPGIAAALEVVNYAGSEDGGVKWIDLEADRAARLDVYHGEARVQLARVNHFAAKIWKKAGQVARGEATGEEYEDQHDSLAKSQPVSLRHILDFHSNPEQTGNIHPEEVDAGITGHALPFVIASMSFGSQGETAFRAYAQAAYWLNIIALNGEGGEIHDMLGRFPHNRGVQIASGRFGITAKLINAANLIEIKVGQGAKPGEGGHLPGRKVSAKIAETRHARPGSDLISPSNNHDVYSIEDLAQFIEELKTANPKARVAVKVPVVPGIGIIAVGIAKAGADVINLSGYDGGTGAARQHSIQHVGLPAEIGVVESHRTLIEAGLRSRVELWCDGGVRSAADAAKLICLGANRIGFGTLAMVAVGCTICRACETGTCHVGIATQIENQEQAAALGLKRFEPRDAEGAVIGLVKLFQALGEQLKQITAELGFRRVQDLVGRSDLLAQISHFDRLDLKEMLIPKSAATNIQPARQNNFVEHSPMLAAQAHILEASCSSIPLRRPRNHLTTVISNLVMETFAAGEELINFEDDKVSPVDRVLGTHLSGALTRYQHRWMWPPGHGGTGGAQESWRMPISGSNGNGHHLQEANLRFYASSVPGNGLGAYNAAPINIIVEGGAQDGVAKGMQGGRVVILKGFNHDGRLIDGSVGKSLAYGATGGAVIVQGNADSRACIRLSGADVIIGGEITAPLQDELGLIGGRANVKGFLCEYMTAGRVLVLGDPGPWICAGMTGGVLYLRLQPEYNFDEEAIHRRIARSAKVHLSLVNKDDEPNLCALLTVYSEELSRNHQPQAAQKVLGLLNDWQRNFIRIAPASRQMDQAVSTE